MAMDGRLAKDVQQLCRHVEARTEGQARVLEVDDNLEFVILHIMPKEGYYRGARIRFKVRLTHCLKSQLCSR
jgi:hypothetical protein